MNVKDKRISKKEIENKDDDHDGQDIMLILMIMIIIIIMIHHFQNQTPIVHAVEIVEIVGGRSMNLVQLSRLQ